ncbi:hypothetical protein B0H14DRAFT_3616219, partial [Mycena olivaceomarginata]
ALHNFAKLRRVLPHSLTKLTALHGDRAKFHKEMTAQASSIRTKKRKKTAEKRRATAAAKRQEAELAATAAAEAEAALRRAEEGEESENSEEEPETNQEERPNDEEEEEEENTEQRGKKRRRRARHDAVLLNLKKFIAHASSCNLLPTPTVYRHISNDIKLWLLDADYLTEECVIVRVPVRYTQGSQPYIIALRKDIEMFLIYQARNVGMISILNHYELIGHGANLIIVNSAYTTEENRHLPLASAKTSHDKK